MSIQYEENLEPAAVDAVASRLANNRANRRGAPDIANILEALPDALREQCRDDARSAIVAFTDWMVADAETRERCRLCGEVSTGA